MSVLRHSQRITDENVKRIGEAIAVCALKTVIMCGMEVNNLYNGLVSDVKRFNEPGYTLSDGYDLAQTAVYFLCGYIGKTLGDEYGKDKNGNSINIIRACLRAVNSDIQKLNRRTCKTLYIEDINPWEEPVSLDLNAGAGYGGVDEIIRRMNLTDRQYETLSYCMSGNSFGETARLLSSKKSTIWSRMVQIRKKYINKIMTCEA